MRKLSNSLELVQTKSSNIFKIKFHLHSKPLYIGELDILGEGTLVIRKNSNHIFKKLNGIGINYFVLSDQRLHYRWIKIFVDGREYISTRHYYLRVGKPFQFSGYELQICVPISELNLDTIRKFEAGENNQYNLFS